MTQKEVGSWSVLLLRDTIAAAKILPLPNRFDESILPKQRVIDGWIAARMAFPRPYHL